MAEPTSVAKPTSPRTARRDRRARSRPLWQKLLLLVATVVAGGLGAEFVCRLAGLFPPDPRFQVGEFEDKERKNFIPDPQLGWRMRPDASFVWKTEGREFPFLAGPDGFRVDERPDLKTPPSSPTPDAPRIAFVGDSFTFGTGVTCAESFGARTAEALGAWAENRGQPGFGVDQMCLTVEHVVLAPAQPPPDLIVVALILDDLERSMQAWREVEGFNKPAFRLVGGELVRRTKADNAGWLTRFLEHHSHVWTATKGLMRRLGQTAQVGEWWRLNAACIGALIAAARSRSVPVVFVHIATPPAWKSFPALARLLGQAEPAVPLLDLASVWSEPPAGAYYPRDGHLTAEGHGLLADELIRLIRTHWPALDHSGR